MDRWKAGSASIFGSAGDNSTTPGRPMPRHLPRSNVRKSAVPAYGKHVIAHQNERMGLFVRTHRDRPSPHPHWPL